MANHTKDWVPLVYPLLLSVVPKTRERALQTLERGMPAIRSRQSEVAKCFGFDVESVSV